MALNQEQLANNVKAIAEAAVAMEKQTCVPAEFAAAQCCLESGYLAKAPGNNPFGIKIHSRPIPCLGTVPERQTIKTKEYFSAAQAAAFRARGKRIEPDIDPAGKPVVKNGKTRYTVWDEFCCYPDLKVAFLDYANLLMTGKHFKASWERFRQHGDRNRYITEMAKVYATDPQYADKIRQLIGGKRLSAALAQARRPKQHSPAPNHSE